MPSFQAAGIEIFVIAVGNDISRAFINILATDPASEHVILIENYGNFANALQRLEKNLCGKKFRSCDYLGRHIP